VLRRESWPSTDGPVEHIKVGCVRRHWFLLPVSHLVSPPASVWLVPVRR
jgi:hypothetical protein